ncbi:TetR/AcrR family transcriptional regulator [Sphingomonas glacialis]|uniref:TetR/AcrR family transcriptional regulator n=1 Tax=Sphingomonas glacialis TaxID=658225 RepID=A0A502G576_9SPHN|nr:helix-turn-helix domain-containing protein [Sphingomonas glacialis]TPG56560.1 TetR/AcrR family transcriptional regulator [Sphingomonas glacialis]
MVSKRSADQARVIAVATAHFSDKGFAAARMDEIAAATATSKRKIYYIFGGKEGLYRAVLTEAYRGIRSAELRAGLEDLPPLPLPHLALGTPCLPDDDSK